jgi:hypothetical protein
VILIGVWRRAGSDEDRHWTIIGELEGVDQNLSWKIEPKSHSWNVRITTRHNPSILTYVDAHVNAAPSSCCAEKKRDRRTIEHGKEGISSSVQTSSITWQRSFFEPQEAQLRPPSFPLFLLRHAVKAVERGNGQGGPQAQGQHSRRAF